MNTNCSAQQNRDQSDLSPESQRWNWIKNITILISRKVQKCPNRWRGDYSGNSKEHEHRGVEPGIQCLWKQPLPQRSRKRVETHDHNCVQNKDGSKRRNGCGDKSANKHDEHTAGDCSHSGSNEMKPVGQCTAGKNMLQKISKTISPQRGYDTRPAPISPCNTSGVKIIR